MGGVGGEGGMVWKEAEGGRRGKKREKKRGEWGDDTGEMLSQM